MTDYSLQVYAGKIRDYEGGRPSAIAKIQQEGRLLLTQTGLEGDEQAEKTVHGGPDRALFHYPREHYRYWIQCFPELADQFNAPACGENLSTEGLTEQNVYMGDIFRWGDSLIQVTQPRSPCFKLNFHLGIPDMSERMQNAGYCGWLYRVIAEGVVSSDSPIELVSRLSDITVAEAGVIAWSMPFDDSEYHRLLAAPGLSASWARNMQRRRISGKIEDSSRRLWGK